MSSASTCNTEGSTASSPTSSVNLVQQQQQQQHQQPQNNNNNAPKYGTLVPNRIFVGGISGSTTETELAQLFSAYGNVKATKVISDRAGVSKGYGFVTFETEEEAKRLMRDSECIVLKERKLNIAPAIKKQPFNRTYEAASPPTMPANAIFYQNGVPYTFHNGVAYFPASAPQPTAPAPMGATGDPTGVYQTTYGPPQAAPTHSPAATAYPVIYPCTAHPTMYMAPQQFQYQPIPAAPTSQYIYTSTSSTSAIAPGNGPPGAQGTPMIAAPTAGTPPGLTTLPGQPYFTTTHMNPADVFYGMPATGQPYSTMITNEGMIYETPPHTEVSSNQSAEQVQFYPGAQQTTMYYHGSSNGTPVPQQLPVPSQSQPRRYLNTVTRKSGSGVSSSGNGGGVGSDSGGKYTKSMVNGSLSSPGNPGRSQMLGSVVDEGSLGGAGDAPPLVPMTPPATPHCSSSTGANSLSQNQSQVLQDACHKMQALSL